MKTIKGIIAFVLMMFSFCIYAQNQNAQTGDRAVKDIKASDRQGTADTPGAAEASEAANSDMVNANDTASQSRTTTVPETTSSQSGSPAVLSGKNGSERDGTNNVQRATMNMVGSPVRNLKLSDERTVDADSELRDRQDRIQEEQTSAQGDSTPSESSEMSDNTRKENNAVSDQNLSSKKRSGSQDEKETEKKGNKKAEKKKIRKDKG